MKFTFITVCAPAVQHLARLHELYQRKNPGLAEIKLYYAVEEYAPKKMEQMAADIASADCVLVDLMGSPPGIIQAVERALADCKGQILPYGASAQSYLRLGKFTAESMKSKRPGSAPAMETMKKMQDMAQALGKVMPGKMRDMRNYSLLMQYFQYSSQDNLESFLRLMLREYGGVKSIREPLPPRIPKPVALYDMTTLTPEEEPTHYAAQQGFRSTLPTVALLFSSYAYPTDTSACIRAIQNVLAPFCNVLALGCSGSLSEYEPQLRRYLKDPAWKPVSLVLNCMPFRLGAGPIGGKTDLGTALLEWVDAPYLHPFFLTRRTQQDWEKSISGCTPSETLISVMLPEMDGAIDLLPVGAMVQNQYDAEHDVQPYDLIPIEERLERLALRVRRYLALRQKPNGEKKVAILCYNYPPGEANLFGGAFLDTFVSVSRILERLVQEGYTTSALTPGQLKEVFTAGHAVNSGKYDCNWDGMIRYSVRHYRAPSEVTEHWGKAPGEIMAEGTDFLIPGVEVGNVFIGLQPARGREAEQEHSYHDKTLPPHHQYVAFYQWIREEFQADALIHVGTHGTLEFLKGKESGMSADCYPDRLVYDLPHFYLYYCGNPSEAVVAKRRTCAQLISYQPPVFEESDLYGAYLELSTEIDNLHHAQALSPAMSEQTRQRITALTEELKLPDDLELLEKELYRMQHSLIPRGLHVFGQAYSEEEAKHYALGLLQTQRDGFRPLTQILNEVSLEPGHTPQALMDAFWENKTVPKWLNAPASVREELTRALGWACAAVQPSMQSRELDALVHALSGGYTPARLAGDIYRSPEVLPSGCNLYQFDSRLVPSAVAMARGQRICENTLEAYRKEEGRWPESTAVILWGLETSRTQGETLGQILAYLGVRRVTSGSVWNLKLEIIPLQELGRPRIDVTVNICGFFRDMFPSLIEALDDVLWELYDREEPDEMNYFRAHAKARYARLIDAGYAPEEAKQLAIARIFGPREGEYGTQLTGIIETKNWQDASELGASFTESLCHVYTRRKRGQRVDGLYEDNLKCVEIVSQLRSNHEYEITDLDHYYEFFGGLAKSVEQARGGIRAKQYITDTTGDSPCTETADKAIARGIRTRVLNPKWIDAMLAHDYHGGEQIAARFENVMGLAATTGDVDSWIYDELNAKYVEDRQMRHRMAENNPHAYMNILEQLMEYHSRGYWNATEQQLEQIRQVYLELENNMEETI